MEPADRIIIESAPNQICTVIGSKRQLFQQCGIGPVPNVNISKLRLRDLWRRRGLEGPLRCTKGPASRASFAKARIQFLAHILPRSTRIVGIQVENAAFKLTAFGTAKHILLQVDVAATALRRMIWLADGAWDIVGYLPIGWLRNWQQRDDVPHMVL